MTTDRAAAEHRGISAAAGALRVAAREGSAATPVAADVAHLTEQQRDYLGGVEAREREILDRRRRAHGIDPELALTLVERLVHRSVRGTIALQLADALAVDDHRSVATFLPVYLVAIAREETTRPRATA